MWQSIDKFLYILDYRKKFLFLLMIAIFLNSLLEAVGIGLIGPFIALVNNPNLISTNTGLNKVYVALNFTSKTQFIATAAIAILIIFYAKSFFSFKVRERIFSFSLSHQGKLRLRLLHAYLRMPYLFHLRSNTAFLIQNIINETEVFCNGALLQVLNFTANFLMMLALVGVLLLTDIVSTLAASLTLLIGFALVIRFRKKLSLWGKNSSQSKAEMIRVINHSLGGLKETRVIGCESYFEQQLADQARRYAEACSSSMSFAMIPRLLIEALVMTFVLGLASVSLITGRDTDSLIATLGVFGIVAIRLMPIATQLTSGFAKFRSSSYVINKLYFDLKELERFEDKSIYTLKHQKQLIESAQPINPSFQQRIDIHRVFFQYDGAKESALREVSLTLQKGESIAFIGKSGAGKTTLVDLILGLLPLNSGDILVDNRSIYKDLRAWQNLIGYIPQSIFLIDDTLERNIAFGVSDEHIDTERVMQAIEAAQLKELVESLPVGIKTSIGERGVCLSGGQRQRVGIARALYHEREILVLDEATSALDNETEQLVTESIQYLSGKKTMIIIAHRLSTVKHCDCIYLMEHGQIVKSGSYREVVLGEEESISSC